MKKLFAFFSLLLLALISNAQIYAPEGLNMPGSWDSWNNPPTNVVFAGVQVTNGTLLPTTDLGVNHYQTIFSTPTNVAADTYEFLFTSGNNTDGYFHNKWCNVNVKLNTIQQYTYSSSGNNDTITLNDNKTYVMNFEDNGYNNTRAIFMELSGTPATILTVSQDTASPTASMPVNITITTNQNPVAEQKFYVRYTTNNWTSSNTAAFTFSNDTGTAVIPAQASGKTVQYYIFSTNKSDLTGLTAADIDLVTINYNNNGGQNYTYQVAEELTCSGAIGVIVPEPIFPLEDGSVIITFDATLGNGALVGYTGDVYAHIGVITSLSTSNSDWRYVKTTWGQNTPETKFTNVGTDLYQLTIPNIRSYFGVPSSEHIKQIVMVIRSALPPDPLKPIEYIVARNSDGSDMRMDVYQYGLATKILSPNKKEPLVPLNSIVPVCAFSLASTGFSLYVDDSLVTTTTKDTILYGLNTGNYDPGLHKIKADATDGISHKYDSTYFYIRDTVQIADLPQGVQPGINYNSATSVTLVLQDPAKSKQFAFVIGDFNNWQVADNGYMNRTPDSQYFWLTLTGLQSGKEYAFQYYIDGELKIADPYCDKILDPDNDLYIPTYNYSNIKAYPRDFTKGIVSIFQTAQTPYTWIDNNFVPVAINATQSNLIIYELLLRDFTNSGAIKDAEKKLDYLQSLGINAIELMPVTEFEGNLSWGYNPIFYFAFDKYYGTKNDYKHFIDQCHQRGISVIMDVVFNHAYGQCPLVQMYWDKENEQPAANNPWFNQTAPHPLSPGYDFNHQSTYTKQFVKRALNYWLTEYKIDGFRFDMAKGFTQTYTGSDIGAWSAKDDSRISILNDYYTYIKSVNPNTYIILEEFADNEEEKVLANNGMLLWGNMNSQFNQITMGWTDNSDITWSYYANRQFTYPNLIAYMESHDEERLMFRNLNYGNGDITQLDTALERCAAIYPLYAAIPGPKMIWQFGEVGYDYSINYCNDTLNSSDCRITEKPVRWDYYNEPNRKFIYQVYQNMNYLKTKPFFRTGSFSWDVNSGYGKREWIYSDTNAIIAGNYGTSSFDMQPKFQHTGWWYDLFNQDSIDVQNVNMTINFQPGDFHVFTDHYIPLQTLPVVVRNKTIEADNYNIYPNPANSYITIEAQKLANVYIYDMTGKLVKSLKMKSTMQNVDVSNLSQGIYSIVFINNSNSEVKKFIKQ